MKPNEVIMLSEKELTKAEAKNCITTSNDLMLKAQWPKLTINEMRLVLYMLALVNKWDEDFKTYAISVKELVNILGLKNKDVYRDFDKATNGLMTKIIRWINPKDKGLEKTTWCSYARLAEGKGFVELSFDPHLKPFLLALKNNFTQYELKAVIRLKNHYSLRIYQLLKYYQGLKRKSAVVEVNWLKEYIGAESSIYDNYGLFKVKILDPVQQDIEAKTDLKFKYAPKTKIGRRIHEIEFIWEHNSKYGQLELSLNVPPAKEEEEKEVIKEATSVFEALVNEFGISENVAKSIVKRHSDDYLLEVLSVVRDAIQKGKIKNIPAFTVEAIKKDYRAKQVKIESKAEQQKKKQEKIERANEILNELEDSVRKKRRQKFATKKKKLSIERTELYEKEFAKQVEAGAMGEWTKNIFRQDGFTSKQIKITFSFFLTEKLIARTEKADLEAEAQKRGFDYDKLLKVAGR